MYDNFGGSGFDWNGNGNADAFDQYVDIEISGSGVHTTSHANNNSHGKADECRVIYDSRKDSDGIAIFKALLVCVFCIGGVLLPASGNAGPGGTAICMLGALALSFAVLKI